MQLFGKDRKIIIVLFLITFSIGILYALYTDHRWEDWYITYRASKNLAMGNGLTFTVGERVYSYTSPINTLLPALFAAVFQSNPDEYAIWLYRLVNCLILGLCSVLLYRLGQQLKWNKMIAYLVIALFSVDILIVDNSINGMETPYMMLFLIILITQLLKGNEASVKGLILAFAGLMYTRPDGFIYAFFLVVGVLLFYFDFKNYRAQFPLLKKIARASLIGILIYLPWILITWYYYGDPIPNTIHAKSVAKSYDALHVISEFVNFPLSLFSRTNTTCLLSGLFMPGYAVFFEKWYNLELAGRIISTLAFCGFFLPLIPRSGRAISFSIYMIVFYLTALSGQGGMPWYLPNVSIQVIIFLGIFLNALYTRFRTPIVLGVGYLFLAWTIVILLFGSYHLKTQQRIVEYGNRKKIGTWLHTQAQGRRETVFMECLGYMGYFSQLKTYDFPGMSSPEVVAVLKEGKKTGDVTYSRVIDKLRPDWVVLRPWEVKNVQQQMPGLLENNYYEAKKFSVLDQIPSQWYLMGKTYLEFDAEFIVFRKSKRSE
ncbi:MAG TPA: hypothetical protein VNB90_05205 [Cytophagaceae bacterium]|jgi:hypothetical protein|nr:hypothetical protein [Cytophagaceae bacterium]